MVKITKKQISLLNDVFNWALNLLEDATKDSCIFEPDENGEYQQLDVEKKTNEIYELAEYLQSNFDIVE
jgi:hypothetical protein